MTINTQSIAFKFNIPVIAVITLVLIVFGYYNYVKTKTEMTGDLNTKISMSTNRLTQSLGSPLWNFEKKYIEEIITSEADGSYISAIVVLNNNGEIVVSALINQGEELQITDARPDPSNYNDTINKVVKYEGEAAGSIELYTHTRNIDATLIDVIWVLISQIAILDIIIAIVMTFSLSKIVLHPLDKLAESFRQLSEGSGDLTQRLDDSKNNEIGRLSQGVNLFIEQTHNLIKTSIDTSHELQSCTSLAKANASESDEGVARQQKELDQSSSAVTELSYSFEEVSKNTSETSNLTKAAEKYSINAHNVINEIVDTINSLSTDVDATSQLMNKLVDETSAIDSVLEVISSIAAQTNLLALNAAIEAARAGEQGRGFAVVADEVRTLAGRTQKSTDEIGSMIKSLQDAAGTASDSMNKNQAIAQKAVGEVVKANQAIDIIVSSIQQVNEKNLHIANTTEQQCSATNEISQNIAAIACVANDTSVRSRELLNQMHNLDSLSKSIEGLMCKFKV